MELRKGQIRSTYVIESITLPLQTEKRLEALGMTKGTPIVRGARFALGRGITKNIEVKEVVQ